MEREKSGDLLLWVVACATPALLLSMLFMLGNYEYQRGLTFEKGLHSLGWMMELALLVFVFVVFTLILITAYFTVKPRMSRHKIVLAASVSILLLAGC